MKKSVVFILALAATTYGLSSWKNSAVNIPSGFTSIYAVTVNAAGTGYAFACDGHDPGKQYLLKLENGVWSPSVAPPISVAFPSIAPNGTVYAVSNGNNPEVYRFEGTHWKSAAAPARFGLRGFFKVAAVGPREFWALGSTIDGYCKVVFFQNDQPERIYNLGPLADPLYSVTANITVPRQAVPNGDCYAVVHAVVNPFNQHQWLLFILRTIGSTPAYGFPLDNYAEGGISAYQPGNVRVMLDANSGGDSRLFGFTNGVFREIASFPERVRLKTYPTPNDGWGLSTHNSVYHWTGGAITPAITLDGDVADLSMVSGTVGWAVGSKTVNGERRPAMWHYADVEPSLTPTSLGRVKAAFR